MIRLLYRPLADGMRAFARREGPDVLIVVNSDARPGLQRTAVRRAIAAARKAGWMADRRAAAIPAAGTGVLLLRQLRKAVMAHLTGVLGATAAIGTSALMAATVITAVPQQAPPARFPAAAPSASTVHHRRRRPARASTPRPRTRGATGAPPGHPRHHHPHPKAHRSRTASPSPGPYSSPPSPNPTGSHSRSPSPSASPSPTTSSGNCVVLLGIKVCL